jgi:hypothetical protein
MKQPFSTDSSCVFIPLGLEKTSPRENGTASTRPMAQAGMAMARKTALLRALLAPGEPVASAVPRQRWRHAPLSRPDFYRPKVPTLPLPLSVTMKAHKPYHLGPKFSPPRLRCAWIQVVRM